MSFEQWNAGQKLQEKSNIFIKADNAVSELYASKAWYACAAEKDKEISGLKEDSNYILKEIRKNLIHMGAEDYEDDKIPFWQWVGREYNKISSKLRRYERGDFTKDEIMNFCHNLEKTVSLCEFQEGCRLYQEKLFGIKIDKKP